MALNWFDAENAKAFGTSLAVLFIEKIPVNSQQVDEKQFARSSKKVLATITTKITEFKNNNKRLNIYKRAQLGNAFKWKLKEAGYASDYINELTIWVVKQL